MLTIFVKDFIKFVFVTALKLRNANEKERVGQVIFKKGVGLGIQIILISSA